MRTVKLQSVEIIFQLHIHMHPMLPSNNRAKALKIVNAIFGLGSVVVNGVTRVTDGRHNWRDCVAGVAFGIVQAILMKIPTSA